MTSTAAGRTASRRAPGPWLLRLDAGFRFFGKVTLALLLATAGLLLAGVEAWRALFALAHLAALIALVPLGVALAVHAVRQEGSLGAAVARHRLVVGLLLLAAVAVALSLANFEDGNRLVRRTANLTTVGIALVLVWRYFAWAREHLPRRGRGQVGGGLRR